MSISYQDDGQRAELLRGVKRVVVKVGSQLLMRVPGTTEAQRVFELVAQLAALRQRGLEVILVTSGAIGTAIKALGLERRPKEIPALQALAGLGQCRLMSLYETACGVYGFHCGQLLLTAADVRDRERNLNVSSCLQEMLKMGVLPVINENDSVAVDEIKFGDNDTLASLVAAMVGAELAILLTTIDGMRERLGDGELGRRLSVVTAVTRDLKAMAGGTDGNPFSTGGMITKLLGAERILKSGAALWIADGHDFGVLPRLFAGADLGTLFIPGRRTKLSAHKRFLAFFSRPAGELVVDAGAARALLQGGKSLLPKGVGEVRGNFKRGDTLRVLDGEGREIARGISNYDSADAARIVGHATAELPAILGPVVYDELIHRDHLVLTAAAE
ncbi:MAG: glutamate 5-kinase [Lentisphaeria bacterium]